MSIRRRELITTIRPPRQAGLKRPAGLLFLDVTAFALLWFAVLWTPNWMGKLPLALGLGVAIARLFLLGHDACHGSLFAFSGNRWANAIAGRLVFLPSLTPYSTWELGHNTLHHGFTNLRGKDYVYAPFTKAEFEALPLWRQRLERIYRHPLGPGLHYAITVWWKHLWFPSATAEGPNRRLYLGDSLLTLGFLATQVAMAVSVADATEQSAWALIAWSVLLPFAIWNMLMGFVTYQQHTNPEVVWYSNRRDWDPVLAQVHGTAHIVFPKPISALLGNIMEHTAHHLDTAIPLFDLPEAQRRVESTFPEQVPTVRWSLRFYLDCCRRCKLYDFSAKSWTDFEGNPTGRKTGGFTPKVPVSATEAAAEAEPAYSVGHEGAKPEGA